MLLFCASGIRHRRRRPGSTQRHQRHAVIMRMNVSIDHLGFGELVFDDESSMPTLGGLNLKSVEACNGFDKFHFVGVRARNKIKMHFVGSTGRVESVSV